MLVDRYGIGFGFGYDPAAGAIHDARQLTGTRPLAFEAADTVPDSWENLDVAFSHEVLYLLADLAPHAAALYRSLRPGGVYFAVMGVHAASPLMVEWHEANRQALHLPPLYRVDQVVDAFEVAGFRASVARLAIRFVPLTGRGHHDANRAHDWLTYYHHDKLLFRFAREGSVV